MMNGVLVVFCATACALIGHRDRIRADRAKFSVLVKSSGIKGE